MDEHLSREQPGPGDGPNPGLTGALEDLASGDYERVSGATGRLRELPAESNPALWAVVDDPRQSVEVRLRVVFVLALRGALRPRDREYARSQRVVLPGAVPEDVREAILRSVGTAGMEEGTDPRWLAEAAVLGALTYLWDDDSPVPGMVPALRAALAAEGLESEPAVSAEKVLGWEWVCNYLLMRVGGHVLRLSLVGPFAGVQGEAPEEFVSRCRRAAEAAGWRCLGPEVLDVPMPGLVYDGWIRKGELTVGEHLYDAGIPIPGKPLPPYR